MILHTLLAGLALFGAVSAVSAQASTSTITELDRGEPYDAMTFNAGYLFVGHSRKDFNANFHVQVFDRKDQLVKDIPLRHSAAHLRRYGTNGIIVVGTGISPNLTYYTIITVTGANQFASRPVQVPADAWAQDWLGTIGGREYFADMGGNPHDSAGDNDPTLPGQTLFSTSTSGTPRYMGTRLRGPLFGAIFGSDLLVVRGNSISNGTHFLSRINTSSGAVTSAIKGSFMHVHDIKIKPNTNLIAISEREGSQVTIGDLSSGNIVGSLKTDGGPGYVEWLGKCLVASNIDQKNILVFDVTNLTEPKLLKTYDFSGTGAVFQGLRGMTIDQQSGRVYGRSAFPCNPMTQECKTTWNSIAVLDLASSAEILKLCK